MVNCADTNAKNINRFQALRHTIADLATEVESLKSFTHLTSYRLSKGEFVVKECSMLKLRTSDFINELAYKALQMFGGYGFMEEYPIARMYRDVRVIPIYAGTSEIMKEVIAKMIIDKNRINLFIRSLNESEIPIAIGREVNFDFLRL